MFDPDDERKRIIESRWSDGLHDPILCESCGQPVTIYRRDEDDNAIYDRTCASCVNKFRGPGAVKVFSPAAPPKPREHCGYCYDNKPMIGMRWCGPCAIRINEMGRGKSPESDAAIDIRIAYLKKRMAGVVSVGWLDDPTMPEILDDLYQAFEDAEKEESVGAPETPALVRGPDDPRSD